MTPVSYTLKNPEFDGVKNIVFDYGGVIIDLDFDATRRAFEAMGIHFPDILQKLKASDIFYQLDVGSISPEAFISHLQTEAHQLSGQWIKPEDIIKGWNAMLGRIPATRLTMLKEVAQHYRIFMLSNTNSIHIEAVDKYLYQAYNLQSIKPFFEKAYYSFEIGMRKPGEEIYQWVARDANLNPTETLFIDDAPANLEAPNTLGWHTHFLDLAKGEDVLGLFTI